MVRVHCELECLAEDLRLARRVADLLRPLVWGVRAAAGGGAVRVVDVGCGVGYVMRWLAATAALGTSVDLVGIDLNATLVGVASQLASRDGLRCQFVQADAFAPGAVIEDGPRTVVISSGLLHHLPAAELRGFFAAQARLPVAAFAHWDLAPGRWSTLGARVFLGTRSREQVSRHDGIVSARPATRHRFCWRRPGRVLPSTGHASWRSRAGSGACRMWYAQSWESRPPWIPWGPWRPKRYGPRWRKARCSRSLKLASSDSSCAGMASSSASSRRVWAADLSRSISSHRNRPATAPHAAESTGPPAGGLAIFTPVSESGRPAAGLGWDMRGPFCTVIEGARILGLAPRGSRSSRDR